MKKTIFKEVAKNFEEFEKKPVEQLNPNQLKKRLIIIETDGNVATIVKAEVAGTFELKAILSGLMNNIK